MSEIESRGYSQPDALVSTDWVAEHLNDPAVRIVESNEDPLLYPSGHIPGAVEVDWTRDLNDPLRRDYLGREGFQSLMRRIGVHAGHDRRLLRRQEQLVGDLRLLGVPAVRARERQDHGRRPHQVGQGGAAADHGRAEPIRRATTRRAERDDKKIRAFRDEVLKHLERKGRLIDVRSPDEYTGKRLHMPEYPNEGALRGGHIPGAANVPWARAVNPDDGTFKTAEELRGLYEGEAEAQAGRRRDRLLPDRRAQQPHLVRAHPPAGLPEGPQL